MGSGREGCRQLEKFGWEVAEQSAREGQQNWERKNGKSNRGVGNVGTHRMGNWDLGDVIWEKRGCEVGEKRGVSQKGWEVGEKRGGNVGMYGRRGGKERDQM